MQSPLELSAAEIAMLHRGEPLHLQVNDSQEVVLVLAEQFKRLKQFVDSCADPKSLYPLIAEVSPGDWEDLTTYPSAEK